MTTFLKRVIKKLFGSKAPPVNHPVFGDIILGEGKKGSYWLKEAYEDGELTIAIDTIGGKIYHQKNKLSSSEKSLKIGMPFLLSFLTSSFLVMNQC